MQAMGLPEGVLLGPVSDPPPDTLDDWKLSDVVDVPHVAVYVKG